MKQKKNAASKTSFIYISLCQSDSFSGSVFPHSIRNHADCRSINMKQYVDNFYLLSYIFFVFPFYSHKIVNGGEVLVSQPCSWTLKPIKDDIHFTLYCISHNVLVEQSTDAKECYGLKWNISWINIEIACSLISHDLAIGVYKEIPKEKTKTM